MTEEEKIGMRQRIFWAGVKEFAEKGFEGATVRDICREAGGANVNAVNYYYGGKKQLYRAILEAMLGQGQKEMSDPTAWGGGDTPEERLKGFVFAYCRMLYAGGAVSAMFVRIFAREMVSPSDNLDEMAVAYLRPQSLALRAFTRELLDSLNPGGGVATEEEAADCAAFMIGVMTYYAYNWEAYSRIFPEHPGMEQAWEAVASQAYVFILGGLRAMGRDKD